MYMYIYKCMNVDTYAYIYCTRVYICVLCVIVHVLCLSVHTYVCACAHTYILSFCKPKCSRKYGKYVRAA